MADWFARQYADIRGNLKWAFVVALWWIVSSYGKKMLTLIPNIPQWLVYCISFLFSLAVFVWMAKLITRSGSADKSASVSKPETPKEEPTKLPEKTWSDIMADEDAQKIQERVWQISQRKEFHFDQMSDPYLDIITELVNASVFDLVSFGEISGHGVYASSELAIAPRVPGEPVIVRIKHGERATLTVRQALSSVVADTMVANLNRGISANFEGVSVSFKMLSPVGPSQTYRWWGPRFTLDEAKRV